MSLASTHVDPHDGGLTLPSGKAGPQDDEHAYSDLYSDVNFEEIRFAPSLDRAHVDLETLKVLGHGEFGVVWEGMRHGLK